MLPQIINYLDLFKKLEYDIDRYSKSNHIYELLDCLLTLNAIPEWIINSEDATEELKKLAEAKLKIMKGLDGFSFEEDKLATDIDQKLRFVRLTCNHSKHKTNSKHIPVIKSVFGATFPFTFPAKFCNIIAIGTKEIDAEQLVNDVADFWKNQVEK